MITDRWKLLDFRWKRAGIIHANQVCLCSQGIDHLVVRLANAYDPLLRACGRLLILKASAAGHEMHENKNGDYLSANHKATSVLQNTRTSHLLHLIVAKASAVSFCPMSDSSMASRYQRRAIASTILANASRSRRSIT